MNTILIVSDSLRRDHLGCYGNEWIRTPNIDAFAADALVIDNAYAASYATLPHRRDLLTGRFSATYAAWGPMPKDEVLMAPVMSEAGYKTMLVSDTNHTLEHDHFFHRGFDGFERIRGQENDRWKTCQPDLPACDPAKLRKSNWLRHYRNRAHWKGEPDRFVAQTMATACDWLDENADGGRFFLCVDTFDPHEPWDPPQHYVDLYDPGYEGEVVDYPRYDFVADFLTDAEVKHCRALYAGEVTLVDCWVGKLLDKVRQLGLLDETIIMLTADHGYLLGEHGFMGKSLVTTRATPSGGIPVFEEICHIPLIVRAPGGATGRSDAYVQPPDIMPTILESAQVETPETVQGKSFLGLARGQTDEHRQRAFSYSYVGRPDAAATVTDGKWQAMLRWAKGNPPELMPGGESNTLPESARSALATWAKPMLFDIEADPDAESNLAEMYPDVLAGLRGKFVEFLAEHNTSPDFIEKW